MTLSGYLLYLQVCTAIVDEYKSELLALPVTGADWAPIAQGFLQRWNFPHTLGALDGKHINCKRPPGSGSQYYNYKKFYSIVLLGLVDSEYKFIWADIGAKGSASDAQIWNQSDLQEAVQDGEIDFPAPDPLPHDTQDVPYFFIGDDAFALRHYMQKPYGHRQLCNEERIFNYRLSRARRVVENAFGILANRFQVFLSTMSQRPSTIRLITITCVLLHNLMRTRYPNLQSKLLDSEDGKGNMVAGAWRQGRNMGDCVNNKAPNLASQKGKDLRNLLKHWCNSPAGAVAWQQDMI